MNEVLIPLGIGSAIPAHGRHLSAAALVLESRWILFDCGEGTQFQVREAGLKPSRLDAICITHLHGDHLYGLPGLLSSMALLYDGETRAETPLQLVGPPGLRAFLEAVPGAHPDALTYPVELIELEEDLEHAVVLETPAYTVEARPLEHRIFAAGYRFQAAEHPGNLDVERARALGVTDWQDYRRLKQGEAVRLADGSHVRAEEVISPARPGASMAYVFDTEPCEGSLALARGVDLLYHEATFREDQRERAARTAHSTAEQAARTAERAGVGRLLLGHFSAREDDPEAVAAEARRIFPATEAAREHGRYPLRSNESTDRA